MVSIIGSEQRSLGGGILGRLVKNHVVHGNGL